MNRVYQVAWSADSRLVCSGSSDSTLKVWDIKQKKLLLDLPGHADEVTTELSFFAKLKFKKICFEKKKTKNICTELINLDNMMECK